MLRSTLSSVPPSCRAPRCRQWAWMVRAASLQRRYQSLACHVLAWVWRRTLALSLLTYAASARRRHSSRRWVTARCHHAWMRQVLRVATSSARRTSSPRHQAWMATAEP